MNKDPLLPSGLGTHRISDAILDEIISLRHNLLGYDPVRDEGNKQLRFYADRLEEIYDELEEDSITEEEINEQVSARMKQLHATFIKDKAKSEEDGNKEHPKQAWMKRAKMPIQRKQLNEDIIAAQSQTITMSKNRPPPGGQGTHRISDDIYDEFRKQLIPMNDVEDQISPRITQMYVSFSDDEAKSEEDENKEHSQRVRIKRAKKQKQRKQSRVKRAKKQKQRKQTDKDIIAALSHPNQSLRELSQKELQDLLLHYPTIARLLLGMQGQLETVQKANQQLEQDNARMMEKEKQQLLSYANKTIVDSQSQTINLIRKILRLIYPNWISSLKQPKNKKDSNVPFLLLNDGHIFFSKTWMKNQSEIVSTPLLFRPLYNPILHHLLQFILRHFASNQPSSHPGAVFYISGDQGIGKTSLMLILMSALSELELGYYYRKGTEKDKATEFIGKLDDNKDTFFEEWGPKGEEPVECIRIYDDNLPYFTPPPRTLSIIFSSPDPDRLPISDQNTPTPSDQKEPQRPDLAPGQICHIFRLPTFSLAEDAVAMVGCTPTVPLALLSPEDMELRKEEQQLLLSIEEEKEERARQLPSEPERPKMSSEQEVAAQLIKDLAKNPNPMITKWDDFVTNVVNRLLKGAKLPQKQRQILKAFLINLTAKINKRNSTIELLKSFLPDSEKKESEKKDSSPKKAMPVIEDMPVIDLFGYERFDDVDIDSPPAQTAPSPQPAPSPQQEVPPKAKASDWKEAIVQLTRLLAPTDNSSSTDDRKRGKTERPNFSEMEDTPESIVRYISVYLGPQNFNTFHLSLYRSILASRDEPTDEKRFRKVVPDWLRHFDITSGRDKEQTLTVTQARIGKQLLTDLMLSNPNMPKEDLTDDEMITIKTNHFFELALARQQSSNVIQAEVREFSASLLHSLGTDEQALPVSSKSTVLLKAQLANLKKHINEQDTDDFEIRQELWDKVMLIKKGIEDGEGTTRDDEDNARINPLDTAGINPLDKARINPLDKARINPLDKARINPLDKARINPLDKARDTLIDTLIDMIITPPSYHSHKSTLQSLFDLPGSMHSSDTAFRNSLKSLLTKPSGDMQPQYELRMIVDSLVQHILDSQTDANRLISAKTNSSFNKRKKAQIACDLLSTIVDLQHEKVDARLESEKEIEDARDRLESEKKEIEDTQDRLESVKKEIEDAQDRLSFVLLMDCLFIIARNMNILVTSHSILKGLSERVESTDDQLDFERQKVFYRNVRDTGLSKWVAKATKTLTELMKNPGNVRTTYDKDSPLEDNVVIHMKDFIVDNLKRVINAFFPDQNDRSKTIITPKLLPIVRSMMNTILFLIDAGMSRHEIMCRCDGLRELLEAVYEKYKPHLDSVANYQIPRAVLDDDGKGNAADYVNDLNIFSTHFRGAAQPNFTVESLRALRLPRTLQMNPESQNRLERMSIALFARNLLWFLKMEEGIPIDNKCYVKQFFSEFLQEWNPGDVVHRSFVDFMNATGLLSQQNFGLEEKYFPKILKKGRSTMKNMTDTLNETWRSTSLVLAMSQRLKVLTVLQSSMTSDYTEGNELQPFLPLLTKQFGVYLLLWASTELLFEAAEGAASHVSRTQSSISSQKVAPTLQASGTEKTVSCLNVARASIFGPSPRWLTSTDVRTSRGVSFLWDGVLKSENSNVLTEVTESKHSRIMSFNTNRIFFENTLDAAWDDMTALVPVLSNSTNDKAHQPHKNAVFSLLVKKGEGPVKTMMSQISFVAVSPFVELIVQSEVVSAFARLMTQEDYTKFRNLQVAKNINNLPIFVEEPLVCVSFLLNCPTPIRFSKVSTSFNRTLVEKTENHFWKFKPILTTTSTRVTSIPMLSFPEVTNRSVRGTKFPQTLSETKRGKTDFYAEDLQKVEGEKEWPGIDGLIVSRGKDATSETIFMPIQATRSKDHSLVEDGIVLIQQLLFQVMCHLELSEGIVAMYNYATTQEDPKFPSPTKILGFHMVSSRLQFEKNTLKHMSSILRHRDRPLVPTRSESPSMMTTQIILNRLISDLGKYPTFSIFDPWTTKLPPVNNPTDPYLVVPFQWKPPYFSWTSSLTEAFACVPNPSQITDDEEKAKEWLDRMVRRTIQELNRVRLSPADLGKTEAEGINPFSSFLLCTAISCRRNELLPSAPLLIPDTNSARFVRLVQSIVGSHNSTTIKDILSSLSGQISSVTPSTRNDRLRSLNKLCRQPCIVARLHTVHQIMSNHAMNRIGSPAQECISVLQSEKDGGVFRVPARNNLSAILHCGTVLLDNITPLTLNQTTNQLSQSQLSHLTPHQTATQFASSRPSPSTSVKPNRSRTLRIPLHSFVLAKYGFSDSIPALCELTQSQVNVEVTYVTPAPLSQWHPHRVVIDPSLLPLINGADSLSLFTSFIHRLFDNPFIPVTTTLSTEKEDFHHHDRFLLSQIGEIQGILHKINLEKQGEHQDLISKLSSIQTSEQASTFFSLLPTIQSSLKDSTLSPDSYEVLLATVKSIEAVRLNPTLLFVKSGSDFFTSPNASCLDGVDSTTESRAFPIAFSTGYKETDLREEMKQVFEPLTRLLPDCFPTGRPPLIHVDTEGIQERREASSSKKEAEDRARGIVDSAIQKIGATSRTPLFIFVVDEGLADHSSLPMSLLSSDGSVGCGMMRQRSLADVLWILFLTRISREVMALPLNTSVNSSDFSNSIIPFLSIPFLPIGSNFTETEKEDPSTVLEAAISQTTTLHLNDPISCSSAGLDLLVSAYPHVEDETQILLLSRLLMIYPSHQEDESRLDALVNHPSPEIGLVSLIRWFQLLNSNIEKDTKVKRPINQTIEDGGFTPTKIRKNLLRAFYLIIEHEDQTQRLEELFTAFMPLLKHDIVPLFFEKTHQDQLDSLKLVADERLRSLQKEDSPRVPVLDRVINQIQMIYGCILSTK
ncbi:hypothetical protein BLNAU_17591 [Blattamonas nauphoetae]|uniref:Uncharacterized protein n=1 Tax=Blattamonas nauphoetae TaxID=2049346 RepID=A0ABQ9X730_9EUKA|nr:hypothetical protein BLNAU_17591 [Blattamonas nauphoetae]